MRTRYVLRNGELVEKHKAAPLRNPNLISDIQPFQTQEGVAITSRTQLREYERKNGVKQVGNDWTGSERPRWWDFHLERGKGLRMEYQDLRRK